MFALCSRSIAIDGDAGADAARKTYSYALIQALCNYRGDAIDFGLSHHLPADTWVGNEQRQQQLLDFVPALVEQLFTLSKVGSRMLRMKLIRGSGSWAPLHSRCTLPCCARLPASSSHLSTRRATSQAVAGGVRMAEPRHRTLMGVRRQPWRTCCRHFSSWPSSTRRTPPRARRQ